MTGAERAAMIREIYQANLDGDYPVIEVSKFLAGHRIATKGDHCTYRRSAKTIEKLPDESVEKLHKSMREYVKFASSQREGGK